ncbi:MAG: hypothetical protein KA174_00955 [Chitinophagales bacterium]|jgi:two-component system NarL family sensor kinase|nr:hypothetical protein [Chitinophagales bacterium]
MNRLHKYVIIFLLLSSSISVLSKNNVEIISSDTLTKWYAERNTNLLDSFYKISIKKNAYISQGNILYYQGKIYYDKGDYLNAIISFEKAIQLFVVNEKYLEDKNSASLSYMWLGLSYSLINDAGNAQHNFQSGISLAEKNKKYCTSLIIYMNMSYIYYDAQNWNLMYRTLKTALQKANQCNNPESLIMLYSSLVFATTRLNKINESSFYLQKCDSIAKHGLQIGGNMFYLSASGDYFEKINQHERAIDSVSKAYSLACVIDDPYYITSVAEQLGKTYFSMNDSKNGLKYLNLALQLSKEYHFVATQKSILQKLESYYRSVEDYKNAFLISKNISLLTDSITEMQNQTQLLLLDVKFETGNKIRKITALESENLYKQKLLRQQRIIYAVIIFLLLSLLLIAYLIAKNNKRRHRLAEQELLQLQQEKELEATKTVLKVQEEERGRVAKDLHDGLGGMLSGIKLNLSAMKGNVILQQQDAGLFAKSIQQLDNAISEMRRVAHNMMPESLLKFGLTQTIQDYCESINESKIIQLTFKDFGLNQRLENSTEIVLYRIIQELVNNTIKHAQAQHVIIQLVKNEKNVTLTVEDDGKGFDVNVLEKIKGFGLSNIQSRVDYLKGNLEIDSQNNIGTSFYITIPV